MKVPKYIEAAIISRRKAAENFIKFDSIVTKFCEKHGIECEYNQLSCMAICEPDNSVKYTIRAIEEA